MSRPDLAVFVLYLVVFYMESEVGLSPLFDYTMSAILHSQPAQRAARLSHGLDVGADQEQVVKRVEQGHPVHSRMHCSQSRVAARTGSSVAWEPWRSALVNRGAASVRPRVPQRGPCCSQSIR